MRQKNDLPDLDGHEEAVSLVRGLQRAPFPQEAEDAVSPGVLSPPIMDGIGLRRQSNYLLYTIISRYKKISFRQIPQKTPNILILEMIT